MRKKARAGIRRQPENGKSSLTARMLICAAGIAVMLALFMVAIAPVRYRLQVGMVPPSTISATKDVVDELSTEQKRQEAAAQVTPTYQFKEGVTEAVMADFDQIFAQLRVVHQYGETLPDQSTTRGYTREELQYAQAMLTLINLRDYQVTSLLHSTREELEQAYALLYPSLQSAMQAHVTQGQESAAVNSIRQIVNYRISILLGQNIVPAVLNACIQPNMVIDQEATEAAREKARDAVEPVVYKQGQNIVVRGEGRVTANQLAMLESLGLLSDGEVDMTIYVGAALLVTAVLVGMLLLLRQDDKGNHIFQDNARLILMFIVLIITLGLSALARIANAYVVPMALCALLMTALLGLRPGIICNGAVTILVAALAAGSSGEYTEIMAVLLTAGILSGSTAAVVMSRRVSRLWALAAGLAGCLVDVLVMLSMGLMTVSDLNGTLAHASWRAGGTLVGTLLCIGLQPLLEMIFNLPTPMKLLELSNPNQPLLRRLLLEAPGTYHHSTIVSNLAEAAAEAVGANPLLARAGGYYHDIGKLKRPSFFAENQMGGVNAHDHTDPEVSAAILTAHTRDGVILAKQYRLPREIQNIIAEHHGNTPVMFFYHKALQQSGGRPVDINAFRYDGHPPRTKEGAIIMLCDTIEAAVRTMKNPTPEGIEEFIVKLVRGKLQDGQLSDCPLTLRDIDKICAAATTVLTGVFHERIEYPDMDEDKKEAAAKKEEPAAETASRPAEESNTVPEPAAVELPQVLPNVQEQVLVISPEATPGPVAVEPLPVAKPVEINELVTLEPLPLKEDEEKAAQEEAEKPEEQP